MNSLSGVNSLSEMTASGEIPVVTNWYALCRMFNSMVRNFIFWEIVCWTLAACILITPGFLFYVGAHIMITGVFVFFFLKSEYQMEFQQQAIEARKTII